MSGIAKIAASVASFFIVICLVINMLGQLARPEAFDSDVWTSYYAEEDNTINAVLIGSSAIYRYWMPTRAYEEQGFTSALLATAGQDIRLVPYAMEEAVKTQKADLFVVEVRSAITRGDVEKVGKAKLNYFLEVFSSGMKPSMTKFRMIDDLYDKDFKEKVKLMIPLLKYHDNLLKYDREFLVDRLNKTTDEFKMTRQVPNVSAQEEPVFNPGKNSYLTDDVRGYIDNIAAKADELGVKVLFLSTPYVPTRKQAAMQLELDDYMESQGYTYFDMNTCSDEIGLDYSTDYFDPRHTNIAGARKVTSYLAKYLKDNYGLAEHLTDDQKQSWTDACTAWNAEEEKLMGQWEKRVAKSSN